jgi:MFS family permease
VARPASQQQLVGGAAAAGGRSIMNGGSIPRARGSSVQNSQQQQQQQCGAAAAREPLSEFLLHSSPAAHPPPPPPLFSDSKRVRAIVTVAVVNFIAMCATSCMLAPFQELLLERACGRLGLNYSSPACSTSKAAQAEASDQVAMYNLAQQVPNLLTVGLIGVVSDAMGRGKALLCPLATLLLSSLAVAVIPGGKVCMPALGGGTSRYCVDDGFYLLLAVTIFCSCGGGVLAVLSSSFAVVADVTKGRDPKTIALCFGLAELWLFLGLVVGPALAGWLASKVGLQSSFYMAVVMYATGLTAVLFLLQELRAKDSLPQFDRWQAVPLVSAATMLQTPLARRFGVMLSAGAMSFGVYTIFALYLTDIYGYDPVLNGAWQSANFASGALGLLVGLPLMQRCLSLQAILVICTALGAVNLGLTSMLSLSPLRSMHYAPFAVAAMGVLNQIPTPMIRGEPTFLSTLPCKI